MGWERTAIFLFGVLFVIVVLILATWITRPTALQSLSLRVVLALVVAAFLLAAIGALVEAS
jgi:hypothetical protein